MTLILNAVRSGTAARSLSTLIGARTHIMFYVLNGIWCVLYIDDTVYSFLLMAAIDSDRAGLLLSHELFKSSYLQTAFKHLWQPSHYIKDLTVTDTLSMSKVSVSPPVGVLCPTPWCDLVWSGLVQIISTESQSWVSSDVSDAKYLRKCTHFSARANKIALIWLMCHLKHLEYIKEPEGFIAQQEEATYYQLIYPQELLFVKTEESRAGKSRTRSPVSTVQIPDYSSMCDALIIFDSQNKTPTGFKGLV